MSRLEVDSMATLVDSLSKSLIQVPPSAIPAMLDCVLLSTGLSPPLLFASLSDDFPRLLKKWKRMISFSISYCSRRLSLERVKASSQHFILVASLIDRIPNLAGWHARASVTAEKWLPIVEVPVDSVKAYLEKKKREGFSILGLEQTANSVPLDQFVFPKKTVLVLGREKEGIPVDLIHILDACIEIPQLGVIRSLHVHVSGAIAMWEYTRQQISQ